MSSGVVRVTLSAPQALNPAGDTLCLQEGSACGRGRVPALQPRVSFGTEPPSETF